MRRLLIPGVLAVGLAVAAIGCGGVNTETTATTDYTETFTGIVVPAGGNTHTFSVYQKGAIVMTLTSVGDDNTRIIGMALGNYSGNTCQLAVASDFAFLNVPVSATVSAAGTLCVRAYDSQGVPDPTSYTITVKHP